MYDPADALESTAITIPSLNLNARVVVPLNGLICANILLSTCVLSIFAMSFLRIKSIGAIKR
jgi:hypothetical protein